jgi:hypothetical protein
VPKTFEFAEKLFQNRQVHTLHSYWITDFSKLYRELLKTEQGRFCQFSNPFKICYMNNSLLKSVLRRACHFRKPARVDFASYEKLLANSKAHYAKN